MGSSLSATASDGGVVENTEVHTVRAINEASGKLLPPPVSRTTSASADSTGGDASTGDDASSNADCSSDDGSSSDLALTARLSALKHRDLGELLLSDTVVRNTFIAIDLPSEVCVRRRSLSCPPGLSRLPQTDVPRKAQSGLAIEAFGPQPPERTALHMELTSACKVGVTQWSNADVAPPPLSPPRKLPHISIGVEVEIDGLSRAPLFNGRIGIVEAFDSDMERYTVMLDASKSCRVKVKLANLRLHAAAPPPPCFEPTFEGITTCPNECISESTLSAPSTPRWEDKTEMLGAWRERQCNTSGWLSQAIPSTEVQCNNSSWLQAIPSSELQSSVGAWPCESSMPSWTDDTSMMAPYDGWQYTGCDYGAPLWEDFDIHRLAF